MKFPTSCAALLLSLGLAASAQADTWPSRPITMVVPTAPGGSTDFSARLIGDALAKSLGQAVVVDNKPGASGNVGTEAVARAKPDGYTLLMQYSGYHVGNPALFAQIRWNPVKDFVPVALVMRAPHVLAVGPSAHASSLKELIEVGKKNGKGLFYASSGNGSIQHIAGELFGQLTKVPMTHVPYKGSGPAVNDLMGGQVDLFVTTPPGVIQQVAAGRLKALAYTGKQRHPSMPNVPTSAEAGLPGYEVESWFAIFAPAGTPMPLVNRLSAAIKTIVEGEDFRRKMDEQGAFATYMDSPTLGRFVDKELAAWAQVIKAANIKAD
ncbi:Bug family tripartite tricarboxylate transporter substrate binding protein [Aquabacterium sp.]|uniref:Bug family tripartite tricarboxylate transporter substrate binding protein n=1 Tax=Aquabacterium sp. TaxID=1872578 RepID=UPI00378331BD